MKLINKNKTKIVITNQNRKKARTSDGNKKEDPVVKVLQEAINAIPTSEMLIQAFRFAEDYRNEILLLSSDNDDDDNANDAGAGASAAVEEEVNGFIRNVWTKAEGMDSSELVMEQTHHLLNTNNNVDE